jgi:cytolysin (calcineurin-like family phosphatase)
MGFGAASDSRANVLFKKYKTSSLDTSELDGGLAKKLEPDNTGFYHGTSAGAGSPQALSE